MKGAGGHTAISNKEGRMSPGRDPSGGERISIRRCRGNGAMGQRSPSGPGPGLWKAGRVCGRVSAPGPLRPHPAAWVSVGTDVGGRQLLQRRACGPSSCTWWVCSAGTERGSPTQLLTLLVLSKERFTTPFSNTPCSHLSPPPGGPWARPRWDLRVFNFSVFLGSGRMFRCVLT